MKINTAQVFNGSMAFAAAATIGYRALSKDSPDGKNQDLLLHGFFLALDF